MIFQNTYDTIAESFEFLEGPVWHPDGYLLFSDIPQNKIYKWREGQPIALWNENSGNSNGLTLDRQGRLIACEHGNRRVSATALDGETITLADRYQGKRLNSPNDCVVRSDGTVFFTDPPYGIEVHQKELSFHGVFRVMPGSEPVPILTDYDRPNGLVFTRNETHIYIADTSNEWVKKHAVNQDGDVGEGYVFANVGRPDGLKIDQEGNLYAASTEGVVVFNEQGERIAQLELPQRPANLAFGGTNNQTLFITARTGLYKVKVSIPGVTPSIKPS